MSSTTGNSTVITATSPAGKKLLDSLQSDLKNISNEAKKKYPPLKEVCLVNALDCCLT